MGISDPCMTACPVFSFFPSLKAVPKEVPDCNKISNDGSFHNLARKYMVGSSEIAYTNRNELRESFFMHSPFKRPRQSKVKIREGKNEERRKVQIHKHCSD